MTFFRKALSSAICLRICPLQCNLQRTLKDTDNERTGMAMLSALKGWRKLKLTNGQNHVRSRVGTNVLSQEQSFAWKSSRILAHNQAGKSGESNEKPYPISHGENTQPSMLPETMAPAKGPRSEFGWYH